MLDGLTSCRTTAALDLNSGILEHLTHLGCCLAFRRKDSDDCSLLMTLVKSLFGEGLQGQTDTLCNLTSSEPLNPRSVSKSFRLVSSPTDRWSRWTRQIGPCLMSNMIWQGATRQQRGNSERTNITFLQYVHKEIYGHITYM